VNPPSSSWYFPPFTEYSSTEDNADLRALACICVKDYDPYFTGHIPRQIYKGGEDDVGAIKGDAVDSDRFGSDGSGDIPGEEEKLGAVHNEAPKM